MKLKSCFKKIYFNIRRIILLLIFGERKKILSADLGDVKSILVIRMDRIGDLVASLPAIRLLKELFPAADILVLVRKDLAPFLASFPWINETIVYDGFLKTLKELRRRHFSLAIDLLMDYPIRPALLASLGCARFTAGFAQAGKEVCFNIGFESKNNKQNVSSYMLELVSEIARVFSATAPVKKMQSIEFFISHQNKAGVRSLLKEKGADESDFLIGCHPGGHFSSQRWPIDNFSRLADEIIERYNAKIIIIGNHAEKKLIGKMKQLMKGQGLEFIGLPLDKVTALISLFGLFIANNSGPLHIGCALNIPTVSTMGPTDPFLWWPQGENHIVLRNEMDCSPCSKPVCTKHACMRSISVEEMMAAVDSQIKRIKHG